MIKLTSQVYILDEYDQTKALIHESQETELSSKDILEKINDLETAMHCLIPSSAVDWTLDKASASGNGESYILSICVYLRKDKEDSNE